MNIHEYCWSIDSAMYIQVDNVFGSVSCEAKGKFNCRFSGTFLNFFLIILETLLSVVI